MTFSELGKRLSEQWPDQDPEALAATIRTLLPLVQLPPRGLWGESGQASHTSVELWLGSSHTSEPEVEKMIQRYLSAFGPASVKDMQLWSGQTRLRDVIEKLRPKLICFRDEQGNELFDLPSSYHREFEFMKSSLAYYLLKGKGEIQLDMYVTRHGQTEWNAENKVCGITDVLLTELGLEQARNLSSNLADCQIDLIISSPLKRAYKTAKIISSSIGVAIRVDTRLSEQNYGVYEGVFRDNKDFLHAKKQLTSKMAGGESVLQVAHRVYSCIEDIQEDYKNLNVLLVTHGSVCRVIHSYFNDLSSEEYYEYYMGNCEFKVYSKT